jgi:hypothetical protein
MAGPKGSAPKRVSSNPSTVNGHGSHHPLTKKRSHQRLDGNSSTASSSPALGGSRASFDADTLRAPNDDCPYEHTDAKKSPGSSSSSSSSSVNKESVSHAVSEHKRIHVGQSPDTPTYANKDHAAASYSGVLPPHQYLDSLAITFFLINLPSILLVFVHILFIMFAVSPYSTVGDRYPSWKALLPAEAGIVLFFALVSPAIRAYITELAEPIIASTLAGNGGRGAAICTFVMFIAGRLPNFVLSGFIRLRRSSPGMLSDTIAPAAKGLEGQSNATDRLGDELQAWVLALIRQLIAIHVVARWSWEGLKRYLTNRVNQSKLEDATTSANVDPATVAKRKKALATPLAPRMPLWTTLANNYIVATKESELKAPEDVRAYMFQNECSLHVQEITSSSVRLCAKGPRERLVSTLGGIDFFDVSVNGLPWREVSVSLDEIISEDTHESASLSIDIHTLVPSTANEIEVTNYSLPDSDVLLFHATICTIKKEATTATPLTPQTVRPNSPISTLNDKLKNAVDKLNELKNTQKRIRKDHKSTTASLRSEIDQLHSRLEAPDKGEERARRGNLALKYHIMQTEEKIRGLEEDIHGTEETITARRKELVSGRGKWESELSSLERDHQNQQSTKSSYDKILRQFHADKLTINGRKEKLTAREIKLKSEFEALESAERKRDEECDDRSRRRREARAQLIRERQGSQEEQILLVEQLETQLAEIVDRTVRTHAERLAIEKVPVISQQPPMPSPMIPLGSPSLAMATSLSAGFMDGSQESFRIKSSSHESSSRSSPTDSKVHLTEGGRKPTDV